MTVSPVCLLFLLLAPLSIAGLALINSGLTRVRSASFGMLGTLFAAATAALVYFAVGFSWQGFPGGAEEAVRIGGQAWGWIGATSQFKLGRQLNVSPRLGPVTKNHYLRSWRSLTFPQEASTWQDTFSSLSPLWVSERSSVHRQKQRLTHRDARILPQIA